MGDARVGLADLPDNVSDGMTPLENARWVVEEEGHLLAAARRQDGRRRWTAFMLAPRVEVAEALLRGESVPLDQLDAEWVARFGLSQDARGNELPSPRVSGLTTSTRSRVVRTSKSSP